MKKRRRAWEWIGFGLVCASGTALHFAYGWSGENAAVAAFSAVNESTWEHMKLLFVPYFLYAAAELFALAEGYRNFLAAKALGAISGLLLIPVVFYTAQGAVGKTPDWFNIGIFFLASAVAFWVSDAVMRWGSFSDSFWQIAGLLVLLNTAVLFILFTYAPPHLPLFMDPVTLQYGR